MFLSMTYVDAPRRQSSTSFRQCALAHIFVGKILTRERSLEEFSERWLQKPVVNS